MNLETVLLNQLIPKYLTGLVRTRGYLTLAEYIHLSHHVIKCSMILILVICSLVLYLGKRGQETVLIYSLILKPNVFD